MQNDPASQHGKYRFQAHQQRCNCRIDTFLAHYLKCIACTGGKNSGIEQGKSGQQVHQRRQVWDGILANECCISMKNAGIRETIPATRNWTQESLMPSTSGENDPHTRYERKIQGHTAGEADPATAERKSLSYKADKDRSVPAQCQSKCSIRIFSQKQTNDWYN